jgi:hypothetical protein
MIKKRNMKLCDKEQELVDWKSVKDGGEKGD